MKHRIMLYSALAIVLLVIILLVCWICLIESARQSVSNNQIFVGTTWQSSDGSIQCVFQVVNFQTIISDGRELGAQNVYGIGTMETDTGLIDIWVYESWGYDSEESGYGTFKIYEAPKDSYGPKTVLEEGTRGPLDNGIVQVTFTHTTFLDKNSIITFYCVDEDPE